MSNSEKINTLLQLLVGMNLKAEDETETTTSEVVSVKNDWFAAAPIRIPKPDGNGYFRTAVDVFRSPELTAKIHYWHSEDEVEQPHNHPWKDSEGVSFRSYILAGGYTETVYKVVDGEVESETKEYKQGDVNVNYYDTYHVVSNVLPNTITFMVCGNQVEGNEWGYLDVATGQYTKAEKNPDYTAKFLAANSHLSK